MLDLLFLGGGISFWFLLIALLFILFFRRRSFGLLDPLSIFLILRVAPMFAALLVLVANTPLNTYLLLFFISANVFAFTLYFLSPKIRVEKFACNEESIKFFIATGILLLSIKIIVLVSSAGTLPVFSAKGSDAYIDFNNENKLSSTLLLGIANSDIVLFSFVLPLLKKLKWRIYVFLIFLLSIVFGLSGGKKISLLAILLSVALGEYLRMIFLHNQKKFFLNLKLIFIAIVGSIFWAVFTYAKTVDMDISSFDFDFGIVSSSLDFTMIQFAYPFFIFSSGELNEFFQNYEFNQITYIFHSLLSPLGFPAFSSSIGPAITEFQTGSFSEYGITPTFIIEGYVLFGIIMPLYAFFLALALVKCRVVLIRIRSLNYKIILFSLFYPVLYVAPIDALLFAKMFYVSIFIFILLVVPLKAFFYAK